MKPRPVSKLPTAKSGNKLANTLHQLIFFFYVCLWSLFCFGVTVLRLLFSKIVIAGVYYFRRQPKPMSHSREVASHHKDQL
jgi:hypothetical protein